MRGRALSKAALLRILASASHTILIGGQALSWWADYFQLDPALDFPEGVTFDVDLFGGKGEAQVMHRTLGGKLFVPDLNDATPQTAKLYFNDFLGEGEVEVDFLASLVGGDEESVRKRALTVTLADQAIQVLHPFDVLRSRVMNLHVLRDRMGNPRYVKQAKLAVRVVRAYLEQALRDGAIRVVLRVVEALAELAESAAGLALWRTQGLDVLEAVPAADIPNPAFRERRWPQILQRISKKRGALPAQPA